LLSEVFSSLPPFLSGFFLGVPAAGGKRLFWITAVESRAGQWCARAFSSIAYTTPGDVFPSAAVGTVQGLGGFVGGISSVIFSAVLPGDVIPRFGYAPMLVILSFGYLVAVAVYSRAFRDFQPVDTEEYAVAWTTGLGAS
jgi:hypothetical protein